MPTDKDAVAGRVFWYFHIYVGLVHFLGLQIVYFYFFFFFWFQKKKIGLKDFVDFFSESSQNWT